MVNCDECGVRVSTAGYLGGPIACRECITAKREGDVETLRERRERYGGGEDQTPLAEVQD